MSKKEFLLQIIDTFQRAEHIPTELRDKLEAIKQELHAKSTTEVKIETNSVVTSPASEEEKNQDWLSAMLYDVLKEMDNLIKDNEQASPELIQACNMLRGELGMAIDPPFS